MPQALLQVKNVKKYFPVARGLLFATSGWVKAVDDVSLTVEENETLGLVGESGCGKTTLAKLILLLEDPMAGEVLFRGRNLQELSRGEMRQYRSAVQAVFQDPHSALNPRMRIGEIIGEPLAVNHRLPKKAIQERVAEVMEQVGLDPAYARLYPHEFSGGQRQRIAAARALASNSKAIVLDEPAASLDVSIRGQIINLFKDLQEKLGLSYLLITHDLAVSRHLSHRVAVMYLGKIVELAAADPLYAEPLHPYTKALLSAALPSHPDETREEIDISGEVPSPLDPPSGCRFRTRCPFAIERCAEVEPPLKEVAPGREVACHLYP
ncbi:MAG: ATP-binding cassette domain-containing protein [Deltaproteobacteria bacterium]|nr:ATP-binding cassette domain-containing protein [Deltaproteobacteria bacterium]